jgi:GNAT superfamily N-acetyltransferase
MWWRLPRAEWNKQKGDGNRRAFKRIVEEGPPPGLLAYVNGEPAGWCAIASRHEYPVLDRSHVLARVDDAQVWAITCFFVARQHRHKGLTVGLLRAAVEYARSRGAAVVEGYPVGPTSGKTADTFAFTGLESAFRRAGFVEVARRSPTRPIMRATVRTIVARPASP